jgi:hypothetical protein
VLDHDVRQTGQRSQLGRGGDQAMLIARHRLAALVVAAHDRTVSALAFLIGCAFRTKDGSRGSLRFVMPT